MSKTPAPERVASNVSPRISEVESWTSLVSRMGLAGMARELAANCELVFLDESRADLRLARTHRHLLTKLAEDRIQAGFSALMNGVKVSITVAEETGLTPAQVLNRTRQESQAMAVTAIESDPVVRELIEGFDASLLQNSIRPIVES